MTASVEKTISMQDALQRFWDAVVIGAGPSGAVAAMVLGRAGLDVLMVDRATFPRDKVCGCCVAPAGVQVLRGLDLSSLLDDQGATSMQVFELIAGRHRMLAPIAGGRVLSRYRFDAALVRQAIAADVAFLPHCMARVGRVSEGSRAVALTGGDGSVEIRTRVVIAAGGLGFAVRDDEPGAPRREWLWRRSRVGGAAIVELDGCDLPPETVRMVVGRGGYVGLSRLEDGRIAVGGAFDPALLSEHCTLASAAAAVLLESRERVPDAIQEAKWHGAPQLTRRPRKVAGERVLVVGDAAGFVEPFTGEGMTWAMESGRGAAELAIAHLASSPAVWSRQLESQWVRAHRRLVRLRQLRCRLIAELLRHPRVVARCVVAGRVLPTLARLIVNAVQGRSPNDVAVGSTTWAGGSA